MKIYLGFPFILSFLLVFSAPSSSQFFPDVTSIPASLIPNNSSWELDKPTSSLIHTVARYSFFPGRPRWPSNKNVLTYAFVPENHLEDNVRVVFALAFERWSRVTNFSFTEISCFSSADIKIGFFSGDHNDEEPFDGPLGTLAHAFAPPNGMLHLDADENWVLDGNFFYSPPFTTAVDLETVVVHEIGHLMGLRHSSVKEAIMYPYLTMMTRKVELTEHDILGIQELYESNPNYNRSRNERDIIGAQGSFMGPFARTRLLLLLLYFFLLFLGFIICLKCLSG